MIFVKNASIIAFIYEGNNLDELKFQFKILFCFLVIVFITVIIYKSDKFWNFAKGFPLHTNSGKCNTIINDLCLSEDSGLRVNYYSASSLCSKRGMSLPTLEDAWLIWISSENCHRVFASNELIPPDKDDFINHTNKLAPANRVKKYCLPNSLIKFSASSQYKHGSYWIKDKASNDKHYAINFNTGKVGMYYDYERNLGVRCVSKSKH